MLNTVKRSSACFLVLILLALRPILLHGQSVAPGPESVVVVANLAMDGSLKVARAYMERRSIPEENLIVLTTSTEEHIPREVYLESIHNPIIDTLLERELIDAFEGAVDELGRKTVTVFTSKVRYMVLCYGVPTKVQSVPEDQQTADAAMLNQHFRRASPELYQKFSTGQLARTEASVDGELAVMLQRGLPLRGFIPNPLHRQKSPRRLPEVLRVTRLDGPSPQAVIRMIDNALAGERKGLRGRAYADEDGRKGPYQVGNTWIAHAAQQFTALGFDTGHDTRRSIFTADSRFDAPVLYAGWYAWNCKGPFTLPGFQFPEGAVAVHLHSFSAAQLRSPTKGWVGPMVDRGVSATVGNVAEPYLQMTHHFDLFFAALADGWNFADAAYYALPYLSWQPVAVGDPLYRPFSVSLEEQLDAVGNPLEILEDQYVMIRKINLLAAGGDMESALNYANRAMRNTPGPAIALRRAELLMEMDREQEALSGLAFASELDLYAPGDWGLTARIADILARLGDPAGALILYRKLVETAQPEVAKTAFMKRGIPIAQQAGEPGLAIEWEALTTPPEKEKRQTEGS